jgi:hypothetical protein
MKKSILPVVLRTLSLAAITAASVLADSQTAPGAGNKRAEEIARSSEMVKSAYHFVIKQSEQLSGVNLRGQTYDALANPLACIAHRANLTPAKDSPLLINY